MKQGLLHEAINFVQQPSFRKKQLLFTGFTV